MWFFLYLLQIRAAEEEKSTESLGSTESQSGSEAKPVNIDINSLKSLGDLGVDISFLDDFGILLIHIFTDFYFFGFILFSKGDHRLEGTEVFLNGHK